MANYDAETLDVSLGTFSGSVNANADAEILSVALGVTSASTGNQPCVTYYKMQASCTTSPNGYITWVNTTGDNTGAPPCAGIQGPSVIVSTWRG